MPPCPHFDLKIVQRSKRQSAVAAAAYQSGERLFSDMEERAALIASYGKEVRNLERRMADFAARTAAGRRTDHTRSPAAPEC